MRQLLPPSRRALWPKTDEHPSGRLADGTPFYGELGRIAHDPDEDKVQCHLCGAWLRAVGGSHLSRVHGWTVREYREAFQLLQRDATVTEGTSELYRQHAKRRLAAGELTPPERQATRRNTPGEQPVPAWRSLAELRPDLARELHPTRNEGVDPRELGAWSGKRLWWRCSECGHEWCRDVRGRTAGAGCPECGRARMAEAQARVRRDRSLGEVRPELAAELHPERNGTLEPYALGCWSPRPVWWQCGVCGHEWRTSPQNRTGGSACPRCARRRTYGPSLAAARPDLARELRDLDPATIGPGSHRRVWWRCAHCGREWEQPPAGRRSHPKGGGCRSCRARAALAAKQLARDERGPFLPADAPAPRGAATARA